jgi:hypothetical protein
MATQTAGPTRTCHPPFPNVAVILGDPQLPDSSKIAGRFSPSDFETIRRRSFLDDYIPATFSSASFLSWRNRNCDGEPISRR